MGLHPNPPPFAEVLTEEGTLPSSVCDFLWSPPLLPPFGKAQGMPTAAGRAREETLCHAAFVYNEPQAARPLAALRIAFLNSALTIWILNLFPFSG